MSKLPRERPLALLSNYSFKSQSKYKVQLPAGSTGVNLKPFSYYLKLTVFSGIASCVAEAATLPIDTAKIRLQLQGMWVQNYYNLLLNRM